LAESLRAGLKAADGGDDFREAGLAVVGDKDLPIAPASVFEHAFHQPWGVFFRIDGLAVHIPE
jgi:hypothetical protein